MALTVAARTVHPHTRGEHQASVVLERIHGGSSPHSWGTHHALRHHAEDTRFIPTLVGNTHEIEADDVGRPVHPHTRGEHLRLSLGHRSVRGSSPHSWGTLVTRHNDVAIQRFIPTLVGNTSSLMATRSTNAVHPHTRGEHSTSVSTWPSILGSSPHSWGTPSLPVITAGQDRFIPTLVGNTPETYTRVIRTTVHPHTRGEHVDVPAVYTETVGSSPHSWGTLRLTARPAWHLRFIPTLVGNTRACRAECRSPAVHPHTRGEHELEMSEAQETRGSSPHSWGTHL